MDTNNTEIQQQPAPSDNKEKVVSNYKNRFKWLWRFYVLGFLILFILLGMLSFDLPSFEELENPRSRIASNIYSSDNKLLGKYYIENRTPIEYDSLSPHLIDALISTEDARYLEHSGIDAEALARVLVKTLILRQSGAGGGSTISQQLAKLLVGRPNTKGKDMFSRSWLLFSTKLKEWLTAVKLERSYTKSEIIALYFNEFDFLYGANGIQSAAEIYFNKHPRDLDINESATLVRMLKNPSLYNPKKYPERAQKGREQVLFNMRKHKHITDAKYHELRVIPVDMSKFKVKDHNDGIATYFRMYLRDNLKELLIKLAKDNPQFQKADGSSYDIYRDGLNIYTTIDSRVQEAAEKAAYDHLSEHQLKMFSSWKDWNHPNPEISSKIENPWTRKGSGNTDEEMEMRRLSLMKLVWNTDRYQSARESMMPTAIEYKLRDIDIDRIFQIVRYDKKPQQKNKNSPLVDGKALLKKWETTNFISQSQAQTYKDVLSTKAINKLEEEQKAIMKYMQTPVNTTVFAYNKRGEIDTLISPFDSIRYHRMHLQTGMMAMDPRTGFVRAWVGGINHKYFQFDHVNQQQAARQVGSTIKPFLYALTTDIKGYSPCYKVWDEPTTISKGEGNFGLLQDWTPNNAGGFSGDEVTLTEALNRSLNSVSAYLMKELGSTEPLRAFLADIGIDTSNGRVATSAAICLGVPSLSPYEMTGGYTIFANGGIYTEPMFVERIEDKNGNLIYSAGQDQRSVPILSEPGAYVMVQMLQRIQQGRLRGVTGQYGGKTGTTNDQADGWFMGITPDMVVGTWVGNDDRYIRFRSLAYGQGAVMARPIFHKMLLNMQADSTLREDGVYSSLSKFPVPETIEREMNCLKYDQFADYNVKDAGNDATNTDVYRMDDY